MTNEEKILAESAANRIVFTAALGMIRELIPSYMNECVFEDKYIINQSKKSLNRMFKHFEKDGLSDHPVYDSIVGNMIEVCEAHRENLLKALSDGSTTE